ncbi:TPA: hypothetical protein ACX6QL_000516 [Photobacterium damselae]
MNNFLNVIKVNKRSGLLCVVFLLNYQIGKKLLVIKNKGFNILILPFYFFSYVISRILSPILNCSLPFSADVHSTVFFPHSLYGVFISGNCIIDENVIIFHGVTIGSNWGAKGIVGSPRIKKNTLIGCNSTIIGPISIGSFCKIGAGSIINFNCKDNSVYLPRVSDEYVIKSDKKNNYN